MCILLVVSNFNGESSSFNGDSSSSGFEEDIYNKNGYTLYEILPPYIWFKYGSIFFHRRDIANTATLESVTLDLNY